MPAPTVRFELTTVGFEDHCPIQAGLRGDGPRMENRTPITRFATLLPIQISDAGLANAKVRQEVIETPSHAWKARVLPLND